MTYVIGDVHGCYYTLQKLLEKVRASDDSPQFVFVGDYVDRGLNSKECVELMIQLQAEGAICLRGNHDDVIDWIVNGQSVTDMREMVPSGVEPTLLHVGAWWITNGLLPTMQSYLGKQSNADYDALMLFVNSVPDNHKAFFRGLKMYWEDDTHFACHAFLDPSKPLPRTLNFLPESVNQDMLWTRFAAKRTGLDRTGIGCPLPVWDKIGVFGHTPVNYYDYDESAPIKHGNLRLIDTGAFQGASLCAYCCEQDDCAFQSTDDRDIAVS